MSSVVSNKPSVIVFSLNFYFHPFKREQGHCGVCRAVSAGSPVYFRKELQIWNNSPDRYINATVCGLYTKHLRNSSTSCCIQAAFSVCCRLGAAPLQSQPHNAFLQKLTSHERRRSAGVLTRYGHTGH